MKIESLYPRVLAFSLIFGCFTAFPLIAQEGLDGDASAEAEVAASAPTQAEFALIFANKLGLSTGMSHPLTETEAINLLAELGITPFDGWNPDAPLTPGDLARMIVQSLGKVNEIEEGERDNPETTAYMDYLKRVYDVDIEGTDVSQTDFVGKSEDSSAAGQFSDANTTDPLKGRGEEGEIDELTAGGKSSGAPVIVTLNEITVVLPQVVPAQGGGGSGQVDDDTDDTTPSSPTPP